MLSESQERMLLVAEKGREDEVFRVFKKWGLDAVTIGDVKDDGMLRVKNHGDVVAEIPNRALADEAPVYDRPHTKPLRTAPLHGPDVQQRRSEGDLKRLLAFGGPLLETLDLAAIRLSGSHEYARRARGRRRDRADQGNRHLRRDVAGRQWPILRSRPSGRNKADCRRMLPESFHRWRAADRDDQQSELR